MKKIIALIIVAGLIILTALWLDNTEKRTDSASGWNHPISLFDLPHGADEVSTIYRFSYKGDYYYRVFYGAVHLADYPSFVFDEQGNEVQQCGFRMIDPPCHFYDENEVEQVYP